MKLVRSELVQVVETKERRTFEYFVDGKRREYTMNAAPEFWADEEMALAIVKNQIKWILYNEKGTDAQCVKE